MHFSFLSNITRKKCASVNSMNMLFSVCVTKICAHININRIYFMFHENDPLKKAKNKKQNQRAKSLFTDLSVKWGLRNVKSRCCLQTS